MSPEAKAAILAHRGAHHGRARRPALRQRQLPELRRRDQPRHRPGAVRHAEDGRGAPYERGPEARHPLPARAPAGAPADDADVLERAARPRARARRARRDAADGHGPGTGASSVGPGRDRQDRPRSRPRARRLTPARARRAGVELEREFPFGVVRQLFEATLDRRSRRRARRRGRVRAPVFEAGATAPTGRASFAALHGLYWLR